MADLPPRPATPQAMVHRLPDKPEILPEASTKPSKFIVLISASLAVAGKVQVAKSIANALDCPLYQGDSLHETAAKAATVGASQSGVNEARYQRMWLSKMTRTGLLFPEESRPAGEGFFGFGGGSSTSTSRRGSASSVASEQSSASDVSSFASSTTPSKIPAYFNRPPGLAQQGRGTNSILMVITHPDLQAWHRSCIRTTVGEYGIGVIFVPLDEEELPVLKPLDPTTMTSFGSFSAAKRARDWRDEVTLSVDFEANVEDLAQEVVEGVREVAAEEA